MCKSKWTTASKIKAIFPSRDHLAIWRYVDRKTGCAIFQNFVTPRSRARSYIIYSKQFSASSRLVTTRRRFCSGAGEDRLIVNWNLSNRQFESGRVIGRVLIFFFHCHLSSGGLGAHLSSGAWWTSTRLSVCTQYYAAYHRRYDNKLLIRFTMSHFKWISSRTAAWRILRGTQVRSFIHWLKLINVKQRVEYQPFSWYPSLQL